MADREKAAVAVGHIPSGLYIVCTHDKNEDRTDGFLASWIQQCSFEPLQISLCVKAGRPSADQILAGETFTVNVVGDHDKSFLKHFWSGYDPAKNPFSEIKHELLDNKVIMKNAKSTLVCRLKETSKPGDHHIVIAEVLDSIVHNDDSKPMVHIRKTGLDY